MNISNKITLLFLALMFFGKSYAAPTSNLNLTVQGTVSPYCYFTINGITSSPSAPIPLTSGTLTFNTTTETPASGYTYCNDANGYSVSVSSINSGVFKSTTGATITYQIQGGSGSLSITTAPVLLYSVSSLFTPLNGFQQPIQINYPGGAPISKALSGTYSDTITFTMTGN
jgi:hypothetical protein